uniref:Tlr 4Fp protein n=1 Tax=Tetrahymena thermophila TaxID=5911 RepID=Q8WRA9_TETTH|nr:Tlr 4Fp protein [Tetrahymena thermophila]
MSNLLQVKQDTYQLQNTLKGFNPTTLAANNGYAEFLIDINCFLTKQAIPMSSLGDIRIDIKFNADTATASIDNVQLTVSEVLVFYYEITDSQDKYFRGLKCIDNRYLQINHASYNWNNITANNSFKFNLTQDAVIPFMLFYIQNKSDNDSFTTTYQNLVPVIAFELSGKNNQSTMNNAVMTQTHNLFQIQKHFPQQFHIVNPSSNYYNNVYMLNFCLNPELAMKRNFVGGQEISDNDYQLKITVGQNISQAVIHVFLFNYQMTRIERKKVIFFDQ